MDFMTALDIGSSGLKAQREYLNVISMNLANAKTTRTADGGPYRRKSVSFSSTPVNSPYDAAMRDQMNQELEGVKIQGVVVDKRPHKLVHEPGHPDADEQGYVKYPDINVVEEMTNMITAMRGFDANLQTIEAVKAMFNKAVAIGRS